MPTRVIPNTSTYKKTFQYRLRPTPDQLALIELAAGAVRFVYNWGTDLVRKASEKREPIPNYYLLAKCLTHLKREPDKTWLKEAYNASLQNGLKDLDLSVKAFFREIKKKNRVGLPGFRKKGFNESIRFSSGIKHSNSKFYIPKIGLVDYYNSRPLEGRIKQATVCKIIDKWFINVVCDVPSQPLQKPIVTKEMPQVSSTMPTPSSMPVSNDVRLIPNANSATNAKTYEWNVTPKEVASLVLNNANHNRLDVTIESTANYSSCVINLGAGFLEKVLEVDATLDKPKMRKKKKRKAKNKVLATPCTNATLTDSAKGHAIATEQNSSNQKNSDANDCPELNESQVACTSKLEECSSEMVKETRDSLRALCKQYSDVFVSIVHPDARSAQENSIIESLPNKSSSKKANRLLVRRQKRLSRSERSSKNREKARIVLEKQHLKIRRRRHDFLHKLSRKIVQQYDCITIKKYDLKRIMLCAYTPLAKVLRDKSWDKFIQYIQYKSVWYGKKFVLM